MSEPHEPSSSGADAPLPSLPVRIAQVFVSPGRLFEALRAKPVWIGILLVLLVVGVVAGLLVPEEAYRTMISQQMPRDADPAQIEGAVRFWRTFGPLLGVILTPASIALVSGLLILAYNVVLGGEASYRQLFSATAHAYVILTAGGLIVLGLLAAGGQQVIMSPALLLPDLGGGYAARLLGKVNIFAVWTIFVLGIAVSRIYPRRSAGGAVAYLGILYLCLAAVSAIPGG